MVVLIVGLGQLGSRHLQGLANFNTSLTILAIEPNLDNREIAKKRFYEIASAEQHELIFIDSIKSIKIDVDVAIISTNADIRYKLTVELISVVSVRYIIFEKVAFQSKEQFDSICEILDKRNIKAWVNCPRRSMPFYQKLHSRLNKNKSLQLKVEGAEWGLACNSIHFLDLFCYLTNDQSFSINKSFLDKSIYQSKRKGFIEFYGSFEGGNCFNSFLISCNRDIEKKPFNTISIKMETDLIVIDERSSEVTIIDLFNSQVKLVETFEFINQSALTHLQVQQIIASGFSDLPTIGSSYKTHLPFLEMLLSHYNNLTRGSHFTLPIT